MANKHWLDALEWRRSWEARMQRRNLKQAFVGESDPNQEGIDVQEDSDEEVELEVTSGRIAFVVSPDTPDDEAIERYKFVHAELLLENGVRVTLGIHADTVGAQIGTMPPDKGTETQPDLSSASVITQGDAV